MKLRKPKQRITHPPTLLNPPSQGQPQKKLPRFDPQQQAVIKTGRPIFYISRYLAVLKSEVEHAGVIVRCAYAKLNRDRYNVCICVITHMLVQE